MPAVTCLMFVTPKRLCVLWEGYLLSVETCLMSFTALRGILVAY